MKIFITISIFLLGIITNAQDSTLSVIGNQKGAPPRMKQSELESIFKGEFRRWPNGDRIIIALMKTNTPVGKYTCEKIYNMSPDELKKFWLALVFQGKTDPPYFFNSVSELQTFVSENPGAIGIIDQQSPTTGTQIILIDGKKTF